jgi:hypothetical protein
MGNAKFTRHCTYAYTNSTTCDGYSQSFPNDGNTSIDNTVTTGYNGAPPNGYFRTFH